MADDMKYMDNIFNKTFENYNIEPLDDDWFDIDMKLSGKNFLRFSFSNFNIYYSVLIIIAFLASAGTGIHYFYNNINNKLNNKQPVEFSVKPGINRFGIVPDSTQQKNSIYIVDTIYLRRIVYDYDTIYIDTGSNNIHKVKRQYFKNEIDKEISKGVSFKYDSAGTANSKIPVSPGIKNKTLLNDFKEADKNRKDIINDRKDVEKPMSGNSEKPENNKSIINTRSRAVIIYEDDIIIRDTIIQYRKRKHK